MHGYVNDDICLICNINYNAEQNCNSNISEECRTPRTHVSSWAVGVTTAPRKKETLWECLNSIKSAGWDDIRIFAEPRTKIPTEYAWCARTLRDLSLGAFPNWYLALAELVMRNPRVDAYLLVQDDAVFARNSRKYLETTLWPSGCVGAVSVYCPSHYSKQEQRGFVLEQRGAATWGALAYIFPNRSARHIVGSIEVVNHRHHGRDDGMRNIDNLVGSWCLKMGLEYFVHEPSLVQHIGATSTIWKHLTVDSAVGKRAAIDFVKDAMDL